MYKRQPVYRSYSQNILEPTPNGNPERRTQKRNRSCEFDTADILLEEHNIAILPGSDFNRPEDELTARISYVAFHGAKALAASYTIPLHEPLTDSFFERYCSNVLNATRLLANWCKEEFG